MEQKQPVENQYEKIKAMILNETDPYKIIGLEDNASHEEINKNYKELAKEYHPDRHTGLSAQGKKEIDILFTKITTAFNLLKDSEERKKFDYEKRMRIQREEMLNEIKTRKVTGKISAFQTQPGTIDISNLLTDKKVDVNQIRIKKAENLYTGSLIKYNKGEKDDAIADLQSAIELNSKVARYHSSLGLILKEKGWNGYAMAEFKIALGLDPNDNLALEYIKDLIPAPEPLNKNNSENDNSSGKKNKTENGILNRVKNLFKKS